MTVRDVDAAATDVARLRPPGHRHRRGAGPAATAGHRRAGRLRRADARRRRGRCEAGWTTGPARAAAVVVGGGYIGVEMAEAMVRRGLEVTCSTGRPSRCPRSTRTWARWCATAHGGHRASTCAPAPRSTGFDVGAGRAGQRGRHRRRRVPGRHRGARPRRTPEHRAGRATPGCRSARPAGSLTDLRMRVAARRGVWAARRLRRVAQPGLAAAGCTSPLGTHANKQGRVVGTNIGGGYAHVPRRRRHRGQQGLRRWRSPAPGCGRPRRDAAGLRVRDRHRSSRPPGPATTRAPSR